MLTSSYRYITALLTESSPECYGDRSSISALRVSLTVASGSYGILHCAYTRALSHRMYALLLQAKLL